MERAQEKESVNLLNVDSIHIMGNMMRRIYFKYSEI